MYLRQGEAFLSTYLFGQVLGRFTGAFSYSKGKVYYLKVLFENYWPWLLFLPFSCIIFFRRASKEQKVFILVWVFVVTISVLFPKPEYGRYLLPLYMPLSVLIGMFLSESILRINLIKLARCVALLSICSFFILNVFPIRLHKEEYRDLRALGPMVHFHMKEGKGQSIQLVYLNPRVYSAVLFYLLAQCE